MKNELHVAIYVKLILSAVFWGGTFIAGRMIASQIGPFSGAFLRFALASGFLILLCIKMEGGLPRPKSHQIIPAFLLGMTGVFAYNVFFLSGLQTVSASRASIIIANNPVFLAICSALFFREHLDLKQIIGICLSLFGAIFVITRGELSVIFQDAIGIGELYLFGCVASWVAYSLIGKIMMRDTSPMVAVTYSSIFGGLCLMLPAYFEGITNQIDSYHALTWACIAYLAFFGTTLGFTWFYQGIKAIGPARSGVFINLVPVSAIVLAFLILGEKLDHSLIIGATCVTVGIFLANRKKTRTQCR